MPRQLASKNLLSRIRASVRLTAFVLLVFGMQVGAAAACFSHDLAEAGFAGAQEQASEIGAASDSDSGGPAGNTLLSHAGSCAHCSFHHGTAILGTAHFSLVINAHENEGRQPAHPPSAASTKELRPPIV